LVLLRGDAAGARGLFAETEKAANPVAKPRQLPQCVGLDRKVSTSLGSLFHKTELYHNVI
jgi:hypothetical protein